MLYLDEEKGKHTDEQLFSIIFYQLIQHMKATLNDQMNKDKH